MEILGYSIWAEKSWKSKPGKSNLKVNCVLLSLYPLEGSKILPAPEGYSAFQVGSHRTSSEFQPEMKIIIVCVPLQI